MEPQLGTETHVPLEVVEQAPYEEPADIDSIADADVDIAQHAIEIGDALAVVLGGDPALGDQHRQAGELCSRRTQWATACGQFSVPIWVCWTDGSSGAKPSGPKCIRV